MIWLLGGYMWLFIHRPFEVWPWLGDLRIERVYMLVTIAAWLMSDGKCWIRNRLNLGFAMFFLVVLATWLLSPFHDAGTKVVEDCAKAGVFYLLLMSSVKDERQLRLLVLAFLACMTLYMTHSLREYLNGRHVWRMGTARMIGVDSTLGDPNSFAGSLLYALPMTIPFWQAVRSRWQFAALLGYCALTTTCILLTGSRTGLVGLVLVVSVMIALSRYRLRMSLVTMVILPIIWSLLPTDRHNRYLTMIDPSFGGTNAQESADSRSEFLKIAYRLWQERPLFGYGPGSFPLASGTNMQVHSLAGQLLSDVGTLGILAFAMILLSYVANARCIAKQCEAIPWRDRGFPFWLSLSVLVSVVGLLSQGLGGHNLYRFNWLWYGAFQAISVHCCTMNVESQFDEKSLDHVQSFGPSMAQVCT